MRINEKQLAHFARTATRTDKHGVLFKRGAVLNHDYKERWFVLKGNLLFYYKNSKDIQTDISKVDPLGFLVLERVRVETAHKPPEELLFPFKLIFEGEDTREYELAAKTEEDMLSWMKSITEASYEYIRTVVNDLQIRVAQEEARQTAEGAEAPRRSDSTASMIRAMANLSVPGAGPASSSSSSEVGVLIACPVSHRRP